MITGIASFYTFSKIPSALHLYNFAPFKSIKPKFNYYFQKSELPLQNVSTWKNNSIGRHPAKGLCV